MVRVYKHQQHVEFEWLVGEIPIEDHVGKEIFTRFETDIKSNGIFYTDSNGREMLQRRRNHRDTWDLNLQEPIAGNYYPVTAKIAIQDEFKRLAILTDRAQGGSSLADGSMEIMVRISSALLILYSHIIIDIHINFYLDRSIVVFCMMMPSVWEKPLMRLRLAKD